MRSTRRAQGCCHSQSLLARVEELQLPGNALDVVLQGSQRSSFAHISLSLRHTVSQQRCSQDGCGCRRAHWTTRCAAGPPEVAHAHRTGARGGHSDTRGRRGSLPARRRSHRRHLRGSLCWHLPACRQGGFEGCQCSILSAQCAGRGVARPPRASHTGAVLECDVPAAVLRSDSSHQSGALWVRVRVRVATPAFTSSFGRQ